MTTIDSLTISASDILVVDDTTASLRLLSNILTDVGYRVRPADRPHFALQSAQAHPPDLILLDIRMPEMDGFELCRRLKQNESTRDIPVIFISALQDTEDKIQGFEAGGVDFVSKPFQEAEVLARVNTHLQLRNMQLHLEELVDERTAELIRANQELRESQDRFRATFEQAAVGIAHVAIDGRFLRLNQKFCEITGYSHDEMLVRRFHDITHPDDLDIDLDHLKRLLAGETETYAMEKRYLRMDGEIVWVNLTVSLLHQETGEPDYFISVVEDISERKQAEQALQEYQQRLKALAAELTLVEERERRHIAADLHDHVSQSLALARIQLGAARKIDSESGRNRMLDEVSQDLLKAIQDTRTLIFDLSSPMLNDLGLSMAVSAWLRDQIGTPYHLETKVDDDGADKPLVEDVRAILFRNIRELLTNVARHAQAKEIQVSLERQGESIKIMIRDDGRGFDPQQKIQLDHKKGGFGLFSIQERMADLGGSLEIISAPGEGCTAVLIAPLNLGEGLTGK